jgi:hypothetical protein
VAADAPAPPVLLAADSVVCQTFTSFLRRGKGFFVLTIK